MHRKEWNLTTPALQIETIFLRSFSAKHFSEREDAARSERARRRRTANPVWENIVSDSRGDIFRLYGTRAP